MAEGHDDCQKTRDILKGLSNKDKISIIMTDKAVRDNLVFCCGGGHLSFITREWDGNDHPHDKEVLVLEDGPMSWIAEIMESLGVNERGSE